MPHYSGLWRSWKNVTLFSHFPSSKASLWLWCFTAFHRRRLQAVMRCSFLRRQENTPEAPHIRCLIPVSLDRLFACTISKVSWLCNFFWLRHDTSLATFHQDRHSDHHHSYDCVYVTLHSPRFIKTAIPATDTVRTACMWLCTRLCYLR